MSRIATIEDLETLYGTPSRPSTIKVTKRLHPVYRPWVEKSRFCVLTTVGPEGTDGTPRGDDGPVVQIVDDKTLAMPDWRGNNRVDSLRNIVRDGRVSLMFMVPGSVNVLRVNGTAYVSVAEDDLARFDRKGTKPRSVIMINIDEVYFQCARAIVRVGLWISGDESDGLPTTGDMLNAVSGGDIDGEKYNISWPDRAKETMW